MRLIQAAMLVVVLATMCLIPWAGERQRLSPVERAMQRHGLSAGSIAYGIAGQDAPAILTVNSAKDAVRPYYSLAKPITAAAALRLLPIDQQIEEASLLQLLQHSGGWDRDIAGDPVVKAPAGKDCTRIPVRQRQFEPGERYAYSNLGYCLIGRAIEQHSGASFLATINEMFPETRAMTYDPHLGPAGGWSGTVEAYFRFASRPVHASTGKDPMPRPGDIPYGLGWAIGPDYVTHFGALRSNFAIVIKQGDFVAVGHFDGRPDNDASAAADIRRALLDLRLDLQPDSQRNQP